VRVSEITLDPESPHSALLVYVICKGELASIKRVKELELHRI